MAQQSVTLLVSASTTYNRLRIGGTVAVSAWADQTAFYTVPNGKRLILKGKVDIGYANEADVIRIQDPGSGQPAESTLVASAGVKLSTVSGGFIMSGVLEDDI